MDKEFSQKTSVFENLITTTQIMTDRSCVLNDVVVEFVKMNGRGDGVRKIIRKRLKEHEQKIVEATAYLKST